MWIKSVACLVLSVIFLSESIVIPVDADEKGTTVSKNMTFDLLKPKATNSFNIRLSPKTASAADIQFPLQVGETVTIKASYVPFSASIDIGIIDSSGIFHYVNVSAGIIDETIQISEAGKYTLYVRNNSDSTVEVSGFVNY